jgi:hypothetical protein
MKIHVLLRCALLAAASLANYSFADEAPPVSSGPGYTYRHETVSEVPWSIHILKVDRSHHDLQLQTVLAKGATIGVNSLPEQVRLMPADFGRPIAAINGDFYNNNSPYQGDPKGLQIMRNELVSAPNDWTCIWVNEHGEPSMGKVTSMFSVTWPNGTNTKLGLNERRLPSAAVLYTPAIGASTRTSGGREFILEELASTPLPLRVGKDYTFRVKEVSSSGNSRVSSNALVLSIGATLSRSIPKIEPNATLTISTATSPSITGAISAISGGPALIREKKAVYNSSELRHPRAAVGWNQTHIYFVEVDGRQPDLSLGMTYKELGSYMLKLGCDEALNLDGGGSATLWILGQVMNSPSLGRDRSVANALVLVQAPKAVPAPRAETSNKPD